MVKEKKHKQMEQFILDNIKTDLNMGKEKLNGQMVHHILANGSVGLLKVKEHLSGQTKTNMKGNGNKIKCMAKELYGLMMELSKKEPLKMEIMFQK